MKLTYTRVRTFFKSAALLAVFSFFVPLKSLADFVDVCTAPDGCTPDFSAGGAFASFDSRENGSGGVLTLTNGVENISFHYSEVRDRLGAFFEAADDGAPGDINNNDPGLLGFTVLFSQLTITLDVDGSGDIIGGGITFGDAAGGPNAFMQDNINGNINGGGSFFDAIQTANGNTLSTSVADGFLSGSLDSSAQGGIGTSTNFIEIGVVGGDVLGGLLAEYSANWAVDGRIDFDDISGSITSSNYLDNDWSLIAGRSVASLDVVVPVPAAILLYGSALLGGVLLRARK